MPPDAKSIGTAIDELIAALEPLEATARQTAIRAACDHLSIPFQGSGALGSPLLSFSSGEPSPTDARVAGQVDIRTFKQQKAPASANEMACVLAYYLQHLAPADERKASVSAADIDKDCRPGVWRRNSRPCLPRHWLRASEARGDQRHWPLGVRRRAQFHADPLCGPREPVHEGLSCCGQLAP